MKEFLSVDDNGVVSLFFAVFSGRDNLNYAELFFNEVDAESYCDDKITHVKQIKLPNADAAISAVNNHARVWVYHLRSLNREPMSHINEIGCDKFKGVVLGLLS